MTGRRRGGLWRQRNFRLFWTGESISEVGNSVTIVVIPLVAIDILHTSTFIVTLLTAMVWLPWVVIGIPAGAWVDRLPPRPVMLAMDAISMAVYASVPVAVGAGHRGTVPETVSVNPAPGPHPAASPPGKGVRQALGLRASGSYSPMRRRRARAGAPSEPCSFTGRQIISYLPPVTGDRSSPSMIQMPASSRIW